MYSNAKAAIRSAALRDASFWATLSQDKSGCWLYSGHRDRSGYGRIKRLALQRAPLLAHRYAWMLSRGDPGELLVLHYCDNPPCCNPDHLFLGTNADNVADMWKKGRQSDPPHPTKECCPKGHPYTEANKAPNGPGSFRCRTCKRDGQRISDRPLTHTGRPRLPNVV